MDFPCLCGNTGFCSKCDTPVMPHIPLEIFQYHIFKYIERRDQQAVMLTCKQASQLLKPRRLHTDKYGKTCRVCSKRLRIPNKQTVYTAGFLTVQAYGTWIHINCFAYLDGNVVEGDLIDIIQSGKSTNFVYRKPIIDQGVHQ